MGGGSTSLALFVGGVDLGEQPHLAFVAGDGGVDVLVDLAASLLGVAATGHFDGAVTLGGTTLTSQGGSDGFVAWLTPAGEVDSATAFGGQANDSPTAVAMGPDGNIVVAGVFHGSMEIGGTTVEAEGAEADVFVAAFAAADSPLWVRSFAGPGEDFAADVAVGADGNIYVVGHAGGPVDFGAGPSAYGGAEDAFVVSLDRSGAHRWSFSTPDAGAQTATDVIVRPDGVVLVGGRTDQELSYPGGSLGGAGVETVFLLALRP